MDYGRLLYDEKPESYRLMWMWAGPWGMVDVQHRALDLMIGGFVGFPLLLLGMYITLWFIIPAIAGVLIAAYATKLLFESVWSFRVYEKGLRPLRERLPFLPFADIDYLRIQHGTLELVTKKKRMYILFFLDGPDKGLGPESRARLSQTIIEQMKKSHPEADPLWLVRDISGVEWSEEALREYQRHYQPSAREVDASKQTDIKSAISEEVLMQGRKRVELADVQRYLK